MGKDGSDNSRTTELQGQLAVISSRLKQVSDDYEKTPSNALAGIMARLEKEESSVKKELDNVTVRERGTVSFKEAWKNMLDIFATDWHEKETRLRVQEFLRDTVEAREFPQVFSVRWLAGFGQYDSMNWVEIQFLSRWDL